jgi:hypothetical protein
VLIGISGTASPKATPTVAVWDNANAPITIRTENIPVTLVTKNNFDSAILIVLAIIPKWIYVS